MRNKGATGNYYSFVLDEDDLDAHIDNLLAEIVETSTLFEVCPDSTEEYSEEDPMEDQTDV